MEKEKTVKKNRIWEIDFLRGFAIFLMVFDHITWDFAHWNTFFSNSYRIHNDFIDNFSSFCRAFQTSDIRGVLHLIFAGLFFLLVGISCSFSKSNLKRGIKILICCVLLDVITYIVYYASDRSLDVRMIFNVLFAIGIGVLLTWAISKIPHHKWIYLALGSIILICGIVFDLFHGPFQSEFRFEDLFEILIGKKNYGSDCFSVIPYIGYVFIGAFIGETLYKNRTTRLPKLDKAYNRFFCFIGRHTIIIYLVHQVVIALLVLILGLSLGYTL